MDWAEDFVPNEATETSEYFVYFGVFVVHSWYKRFVQAAKDVLLFCL